MAKAPNDNKSILTKLSIETTLPDSKLVTGALAEIKGRYLADQSRNQLYRTLCDIYHLYWILKRHHISKTTTRLIVSRGGQRQRARHPLKILINAVFPLVDRRQQSRRFQALDFARHKKISPKRLFKVIEANEGIAGLARLNAGRQNYKRQTSVWD